MGTLQGLCIRQEGALEDKYVSVAEGVSVAAAVGPGFCVWGEEVVEEAAAEVESVICALGV